MFCSLIGLSPCDVIILGIDYRTIRILFQALDNPFDAFILEEFREETDYVLKIINGMRFEYKDKEIRSLVKKHLAKMTAFGGSNDDQIEEVIKNAQKEFSGSVEIDGKVLSISSCTAAMQILQKLHDGKDILQKISASIRCTDFSEEKFFGRSVIDFYSMRKEKIIALAVDRIALQDKTKIQNTLDDAARLLAYIFDSTKDEGLVECSDLTVQDVAIKYKQLTGRDMTNADIDLADRFSNLIRKLGVSQQVEDALLTIFIHCMVSTKQYDCEAAEKLEMLGLCFMNPVRAEFMLSSLADRTMVQKTKPVLKNSTSTGDTYKTVLSSIIAACDNQLTAVGDFIDGGVKV